MQCHDIITEISFVSVYNTEGTQQNVLATETQPSETAVVPVQPLEDGPPENSPDHTLAAAVPHSEGIITLAPGDGAQEEVVVSDPLVPDDIAAGITSSEIDNEPTPGTSTGITIEAEVGRLF